MLGTKKGDMLSEALAHLAGGRIVFPMRNKKPLINWGKLIYEPPNAKEVASWFGRKDPRLQMAMLMGQVSGGIFAIEFFGAGETTPSVMDSFIPKTTVYSQSGKATTAFYRYPGKTVVESGRKYLNNKGIEIRFLAEKSYVFIPPSALGQGRTIKWEKIGPDAWDNLPEWNPINFIKQFA